MQLRADGPDVWYAEGIEAFVGPDEIAFLKEHAAASARQRARICLHENVESVVHEMVIVHGRSCYVRPARHPHKRETMTVLEGTATAVFFDDSGAITSTHQLSANGAKMWRVPPNTWHGLVITSDWLVFYEVSKGPWQPAASEYPGWAPDQHEPSAGPFLDSLRSHVDAHV